MSKPIITQEQADAIEQLRRHWSDDEIIARSVKGRVFGQPYNDCYKHLEKNSLFNLTRALERGYEVEPEFKVNQWVTHESGTVSKITSIDDRGIITTDHILNRRDQYGKYVYMNTVAMYFRHATPEEIAKEKERRFWAKYDRDVWELFEGDILKRLTDNEFVYVVEVGDGITVINIINDYTFEEYTKNELREEFSVFYLSEDRKDV